jgi:3-oxoacyl-[acyl-carrier protein] reductase
VRDGALVFGGTGHVGAAVLRGLHRAGVPAAFTYRASADRAAAIAAELSMRAMQVDLADAAAVRDLFRVLDAEGRCPDVFVHAAAVVDPLPLDAISDAGWDAAHAVNLRSAFIACQELARRWVDQGREGHIVLTAALDGVHAVKSPLHFATSQAGRIGLARTLAKELGPRGIRVNVVTLGVLDGGISRGLDPGLRADYLKFSAMGRIGAAEEAARPILWLGLENSYMTGAVLPVTGGL